MFRSALRSPEEETSHALYCENYVSFQGYPLRGSAEILRARRRCRIEVAQDAYHDYSPVWSPDGERVAYYSNVSGNYEIWVANRDGSNRLRLSD